MSGSVDTEHSCDQVVGQLRMTLSRRDFVTRTGWLAGGAVALSLVGCGEDDDAPRSETQEAPVAQVEQEDRPQPPPPEPQAAEADPPEPAQPEPPAEQEPTEPEPAAVEQQPSQQQEQQVRAQQPRRPAQPEPPTERRLLVADVQIGEYELEDPAFDPVGGARVDFGEIEGAGYRIELPEQWNGELVLWAHGFRGLDDDGTGFSRRLTFDDIPARNVIIGQGYGWATSTYRVNGYVPGVGVDDLLRVKDRVGEIARPPRRTYIAGGSMGGATAQLMAQEFPDEIAAALAFCPAMGNIWVADYIFAWHALAHWLIGSPPVQIDPDGLIQWASALGELVGDSLRLTEQGEQFFALIKEFTGGARWGVEAGFAQQWPIAFALGVTVWPGVLNASSLEPGSTVAVGNDQPPVDTRAHVYAADASAGIDLAALNAEVIRAAADPVRRRDPGVGAPSGELRVPLLAMKTTGDLFTPIHLDRDYQRLVEDSGGASNLVIQSVRRAGHCAFSEAEALAAFSRIVAWLSFGFAPAGDDLQGDLSLVGTRFTDPFDEDDPLRPTA